MLGAQVKLTTQVLRFTVKKKKMEGQRHPTKRPKAPRHKGRPPSTRTHKQDTPPNPKQPPEHKTTSPRKAPETATSLPRPARVDGGREAQRQLHLPRHRLVHRDAKALVHKREPRARRPRRLVILRRRQLVGPVLSECIVGKKRKHRHPHSHPPHNHRRPLTMARRRPRLADSPFFSPEGVTWQFTGTVARTQISASEAVYSASEYIFSCSWRLSDSLLRHGSRPA